MPIKTPLFALSLTLSILTTTAQTVDKIFAQYVHFLGGEKRVRSIQTCIDSGSYNYGGIEFPFVSYAQSPDHYKYIVTFKGKYFAQAFDGNEGWKIDVFKNEKSRTLLHGKQATAMANEADVHIEPPFIDYKQKGYVATLEGVDTVAGNLCRRIRLRGPDTDTALYFFDQQTGALLKKVAVTKNAELNGATLETFYTDYKEIDEIMIPLTITHKIKEQTVLTITIKGVILNPHLPTDIFSTLPSTSSSTAQ